MKKIMLAPLDNETIFKRAFTDKEVFQHFIKDLFDIDIVVDKIETEKQFSPPISQIDIKLDIYAESTDHQFVIEIQKIDYDDNFDRFLNYFLSLIVNQQKSANDYSFKQRVLGVVVFARPYRFDTKDKVPVRDNVLLFDFNPKNLKGEYIKLYEHNMIFLNPSKKYFDATTPKNYQDWLDLFYASMKEPEQYRLNLNNKGISRAVSLIDFNKLDGTTLRIMKENESRKKTIAHIEYDSKEEGRMEGRMEGEVAEKDKRIIIAINKGKLTTAEIAEMFEVSNEYVLKLLKKHKM